MLRHLRIATFLGALLVLTGAFDSTSAFAQEKQQVRKRFKDKIHVVQPKPVLQKGRFEVAPRFGMTINDAINRNYKVGANLNYHLIEPLYLGALGEWYNFGGVLGGPTGNFRDVQTETGTAADAAYVNWLAGLELGYVPIWGKFALFNRSIIFYDIAITLGGAAINTASLQLPTEKVTGGGTISLQNRIFLSKWLALNFEVRDFIFMADLAASPNVLTNIVSASLGLSFYLPTSFEYTEKVVDAPGS